MIDKLFREVICSPSGEVEISIKKEKRTNRETAEDESTKEDMLQLLIK